MQCGIHGLASPSPLSPKPQINPVKDVLGNVNMAHILDNSDVVMLKFLGEMIVWGLYRRMPCSQKTGESMGEMSQQGQGQNRGKIQHNLVNLGEEYSMITFQFFCTF